MNVHYSASQIKTFSRCARQWHLDKWSSFPTPPAGAGAALGGLVHSEIESFLYGKTGSLHEVAEPGRDFLEWLRAKPALLIEHTINRDGIVGVIDVYTDGLVIDHKTSSDPEKWGLTPDQLANDLQMTIYAAWSFNKEPERQLITIAHAYYGTKRRSFKLVKATVSRERIERQYQEAIAFTRVNMAHLATSEIDSFDIPGTASACGAFGGCGFLKICNPKKGAQIMPTLQELLAKRQPKVEVIAPEAPSRETPPEAAEAAPPLEAAIDIQKAVDAICKAHPSTTQAALSIAKTATNAKRWTKNRTAELVAAAGGRFTFDDLGSVIYKDTPAAVPFRTPRPTTAIPSAPTGGGLTLYINAIPIKGATGTTFADLIAAAVKAYPTDPQLVDYGKGIADIVATVEPPAFGVVFVDTANPYWGRASQKWISCAAVVVRGV
mgnify:CR=1 FL=1